MKISLNWLKQYVDIPQDLSAEELALQLTMSTVEVEGIINQGERYGHMVVGEIAEIVNHPQADKLKVLKVRAGKSSYQVICGAGNVYKGMKGVLALPGAMVKWHGEGDLTKLEKTKIRGVESEGMLCAPSELGLKEEFKKADGLVELKAGRPGQPVAELLGLDDVIFEIDNKSITHRPDLWGHYGVARELAAILGKKLRDLNINQKIEEGNEVNLKIKIESQEICSRYIGAVMGNIKIEPSPLWMQQFLTAVGTRPINNIVDITNYVMLELGRPSHAFDRRNVQGDTIIVRKARAGEKFKTLDGQERKMTAEMCLVCDNLHPIDLGGIMGGENSEIKDDTEEIILELANFNPVNIRKTVQALDLRTEAAMRFEKSLPPELSAIGLKRIITLIKELIPSARVISQIVDINYGQDEKRTINLNLDFLDKRVGQSIPKKEVIKILESLSFKVKVLRESLEVSPPDFRSAKDISLAEDLVEEVSRIYGYVNITPVMPKVEMTPPEENRSQVVKRKVKDILSVGLALDEVYNYSFTSGKNFEVLNLKPEEHFALANFLSEEQRYLRISLFENLIKNLEDNLRFFDEINIFELGRVYTKGEGEYAIDNKKQAYLGKQEEMLAGLVVSKNKEPFYQVKGIVETLLNDLEIDYNFQQQSAGLKWLNRTRYLEIKVADQLLAWVSEISPQVLNRLDIKKTVGVWQLNFELLVKHAQDNKKYQPLPKYPGIVYDFSIIIPQRTAWALVRQEVKEVSNLIKRVELFDVYRRSKLGPEKKSLAFHVYLQDDKKTLTAKEADKLREKIVDLLKRKFGAEIR